MLSKIVLLGQPSPPRSEPAVSAVGGDGGLFVAPLRLTATDRQTCGHVDSAAARRARAPAEDREPGPLSGSEHGGCVKLRGAADRGSAQYWRESGGSIPAGHRRRQTQLPPRRPRRALPLLLLDGFHVVLAVAQNAEFGIHAAVGLGALSGKIPRPLRAPDARCRSEPCLDARCGGRGFHGHRPAQPPRRRRGGRQPILLVPEYGVMSSTRSARCGSRPDRARSTARSRRRAPISAALQ